MTRIPLILGRRAPVIHTVSPKDTVSHAAKKMCRAQVGAVAVMHGGRLVGIFTERDVMCRVVAAGRDPETTSIGSVMTPDPVVALPSEGRCEAIEKMRARNCRHLPVVQGGRFTDMASIRDLLFCELDHYALEVESLRHYISGSY